MLPRRLGARFALEALFLVLLALGAGLAHLRPLYIVIVMAGAWLLVALAELTAERIDRSPLSYLLPSPDEEEPQRVFGPRPEERTVVAPPEQGPLDEPEEVSADTGEVEAPIPAAFEEGAPVEDVPDEAEDTEPEDEEREPSLPSRLRSMLGRREPETDPAPASPPRHVKLLPRRTADEPSRASQDVADLFGAVEEDDEQPKPGEAGK